MSQSDESWLPRFEKRDDHWVVHYEGQEWWLTTAPRREYAPHYMDTWGPRYNNYYPLHKLKISFEMVLHPPAPDLSIPDNIILGDN